MRHILNSSEQHTQHKIFASTSPTENSPNYYIQNKKTQDCKGLHFPRLMGCCCEKTRKEERSFECLFSHTRTDLRTKLFHKGNSGVLFLGEDNSGKTTLLMKLKGINIMGKEYFPTIGFNNETLGLQNKKSVKIRDIGPHMDPYLWVHFYQSTNMILFFINAQS